MKAIWNAFLGFLKKLFQTKKEEQSPPATEQPVPPVISIDYAEIIGLINSTDAVKSVDLANKGRINLPVQGKFCCEAHYATKEETFNGSSFPSSKTEGIGLHMSESYAAMLTACPWLNDYVSDMKKVYNQSWKTVWTPANDGSINEFGQGSRGNLKPSRAEEMWQGNMLFKGSAQPSPGTRFLMHNPTTERYCVIQMGYEIGPGASSGFIGGLVPEVHWWLGSQDDTVLTLYPCAQSAVLGPVKPGAAPTAKPVEVKPATKRLGYMRARIGWTEFDHDKELSENWRFSKDCKGYKTVIGATHAWCGVTQARDLYDAGYDYPRGLNGEDGCEAAFSYLNYGTEVDWRNEGLEEGDIVVLKSSHVTAANERVPAGFSTFPGLGGNQSNAINVTRYAASNIAGVRRPVKL